MYMRYVDVLLPVALDGPFTYSASDGIAVRCSVGSRVLVPFGASKTYAGIVVRVHDDKPILDDSKIKSVLTVLDPYPVLFPQQLQLWRWIASYYMCPMGDVMAAALPSGLKADTEYKPKMETYVALSDQYASEQGLRIATEILRKSPRQLQVFKTFLNLMAPLEPIGGNAGYIKNADVTVEELLNEAHATVAILRKLVSQGFLRTYEEEVVAEDNTKSGQHNSDFNLQTLTAEQDKAKLQIEQLWGLPVNENHKLQTSSPKPQAIKNVVLLHGVTSSGKTEIYIHLIKEAICRGQQVLYLLPEIALTVQMTQRLQRVFGSRLGIYHSKYSDADRVRIWRKQLSPQPYDVVLGARSAVFLPFRKLGLVIVDEEHVQSFKQQDPAPRYHARSVAIVLAQMYKAKTLLGTATPSVESWYNATTGKYGLVSLGHRYKGIELPEIEVVDIKNLRHRRMMNGPFSPRLLSAMRDALSDGKQVIIFQNRRGFAPVLSCPVCGWTPKCKNCDVTLTYHKRLNLLTCHYCGYTEKVPDVCPCCGNTHLSDRGYGTEKIEDLIMSLFPDARVARMDLDTTHTRNAYGRLISDFSSGKTNILIGTQMVTKGLDFANVALVGILDADSMLNYPDFRAYEQAFQMMSQVAGRAGRKGRRGLVILQTKDPTLPVIQDVVSNDYKSFFREVLEERSMFNYPPYCHLVYIYLRHKEEGIVEMASQEMAATLKRNRNAQTSKLILGPDKPAVARVRNMYIRKIVVKVPLGADQKQTRHTLYAVRDGILSQPVYKSVQIFFDVDPE